jgi:hypothetical protein
MNDQKKEVVFCECCGAKLTGRWERLSKGLVSSLLKFRNAVISHQRNKIHLAEDMDLTKNEYNNFQKLRYHGMIAHCPDASGYWLLTRRGNLFCKAEIEVAKRVYIFRNRIKEKSTELIGITDVMKSNEKYWDKYDDFKLTFIDTSDIEGDELWDKNQEYTQTKLFNN